MPAGSVPFRCPPPSGPRCDNKKCLPARRPAPDWRVPQALAQRLNRPQAAVADHDTDSTGKMLYFPIYNQQSSHTPYPPSQVYRCGQSCRADASFHPRSKNDTDSTGKMLYFPIYNQQSSHTPYPPSQVYRCGQSCRADASFHPRSKKTESCAYRPFPENRPQKHSA